MVFTWNFDPIAFTIPFLDIGVRWYGIMFAGGFILGYFFVHHIFITKKLNTNILDSLLFYMFAGTILGARLGHCFFYDPSFYLQHPFEIIKIWHGGLASHGGGIGLIIAVLIFCKIYKLNFLPLADLLCIPTAFVGGMIRLGNFFNSEIVGKLTENADFGIIFLQLHEKVPMPRHPVQLYESIIYFLIAFLLWSVYKHSENKRTGFVLGLFLIFVFVARLFLEVFKPEQAHYMSADELMTVGQWLSIPFIVVGLVLVILSIMKKFKKVQICTAQ